MGYGRSTEKLRGPGADLHETGKVYLWVLNTTHLKVLVWDFSSMAVANASSELNVRKLLKNNVVNEKEGILN